MHSTDLESEIEMARKTVHVDSYPMSIGELVNLYRDGDLNIQPEFQRIFRWKDWQKSQFIESILLGIPIPSIFVAQQHDGRWDVVDGLQRLSTILQFLGVLKGEDGECLDPLEMQATKYLPSLEGKVCFDSSYLDSEINFEEKKYQERLIHPNIQRSFKREKVDLKIIKKESNQDAKLELFQRLNTGGSKLTPQEVRNCILLMVNKVAFEWLQTLSNDSNFQETLSISINQEEQSYANELLIKYFTLRHFNLSEIEKFRDVHPYLDEATQRVFNPDFDFDYLQEEKIFKETFKILNEALGEKAFKKFYKDKNDFQGSFSVPVFECLTVAVSTYLDKEQSTFNREQFIQELKEKAKNLSSHPKFLDADAFRPNDKTKKMYDLGRELF